MSIMKLDLGHKVLGTVTVPDMFMYPLDDFSWVQIKKLFEHKIVIIF